VDSDTIDAEAAWRRGVARSIDDALRAGVEIDADALTEGDPSRREEVDSLIELRRALFLEFSDGAVENDAEPDDSPLSTAERLLSEACERGEVADLGVLKNDHPELSESFDELSRFYRFLVDALSGEAPTIDPNRGLPERRIGKYVLETVLGPHPIGRVDSAREERTGARRVLHLLNPALPKTTALRLLRGAASVRRLADPGFAPLIEVGEAEGVRYLAYEDVGGVSLELVLKKGGAAGAPTDVGDPQAFAAAPFDPNARTEARYDARRLPSAARVVSAVAASLHRAHAQGVLHLDLRPANVLLAEDRRVLLRGAGLAGTAPAAWRTVGAARAFLAPEVLEGGDVQPDWRADVYGCCALLFALLRMEPPPADADAARRALAEAPEPLRDVVARGLSKDPRARPSSCVAIAEALKPFTEGRGLGGRRSKKAIAVAAALLALAVATAVFALL
jgi:serine/threonine protein kinase